MLNAYPREPREKKMKYKAEKAGVVRKDAGKEQKCKREKATWSSTRKGVSPFRLPSPAPAPAAAQVARVHGYPPDTGSLSMPGVVLAAGDAAVSKANKVLLAVDLHSTLVSEQNQSQKEFATVVTPSEQRSRETSRGNVYHRGLLHHLLNRQNPK